MPSKEIEDFIKDRVFKSDRRTLKMPPHRDGTWVPVRKNEKIPSGTLVAYPSLNYDWRSGRNIPRYTIKRRKTQGPIRMWTEYLRHREKLLLYFKLEPRKKIPEADLAEVFI